MPQQLSPSEDFPIVRVLSDHTDVSTNYVQAVITDATTDAVLATLNLDDKGNRRFKKIWHVPYDNVYNRGRFIVITTTVYTDSGYTTKNPNYGEDGETYLVQQRFDLRYLPVGESVDYIAIRKLVNEELAALKLNELEPMELPEPVDFTPHVKAITDSVQSVGAQIAAKVDSIKIPVPEKQIPTDLTPLITKLTALSKELANLPRYKEPDLSPVLATIASQLTTIQKTILDGIKSEVAKPKNFTLSASPQDQAEIKRTNQLTRLAKKHGV